jgi:hypothetical protein
MFGQKIDSKDADQEKIKESEELWLLVHCILACLKRHAKKEVKSRIDSRRTLE